jgi:hypothetical protein
MFGFKLLNHIKMSKNDYNLNLSNSSDKEQATCFMNTLKEKYNILEDEIEKLITLMNIKEKNNISDEKTIVTIKEKTWTITFSESIENHVGMQQIGEKAKSGFSLEEITNFSIIIEKLGYKTEIIDLTKYLPNEEKYKDKSLESVLLIVRNGIEMLSKENYKNLIKEVKESEKIVDKKAFMKGRVVNKLARHNLCYADESQEADYPNKKGTIVAFRDVPYIDKVRNKLGELFGEKCINLKAELNFYYDLNKCYINFHGDSERRRVIGLRFGSDMNLQYQWFQESKPIGERIEVILSEGDMYIMSEKAVGTDWKKRIIPTLRHAAGSLKLTNIKSK